MLENFDSCMLRNKDCCQTWIHFNTILIRTFIITKLYLWPWLFSLVKYISSIFYLVIKPAYILFILHWQLIFIIFYLCCEYNECIIFVHFCFLSTMAPFDIFSLFSWLSLPIIIYTQSQFKHAARKYTHSPW